jgi:glucosamine--fructose-6-phosphate aminotransferase (isomerizing)
MCGIVGYIGAGEAAPFLTTALKRLEYRGYDSAGLVTLNGHGLEVRKSLGKVSALEALVLSNPPQGRVGIAHTRWATHGRPSEQNAHPHLDCAGRVAVVHNGVIENHAALRRRLSADGHAFRSDTDTEVIAHLIESHMRRGLSEAVRRTAHELRGAFAIACISEDEPGVIVAARAGTSPLVLAFRDGEAFLASDTPALGHACDESVMLEDGDVAVITTSGVRILMRDGAPVVRAPRPIQARRREVDKAGYRDFMLKEIFEQPEVVERLWTTHVVRDEGRLSPAALPIPDEDLRAIERVSFIACGTSRHAGLIGQSLVEEFAGIPAESAFASEWRYRRPIYSPATLVVPISQSGETADTLGALRQAKDRGARTFGICNAPASSLARESDAVFDTDAGLEVGVAATKSYVAQLGAVLWLALKLGTARGTVSEAAFRDVALAVGRAPQLMKTALQQSDHIRAVAERCLSFSSALYVGRGLQYPMALEGALKLKEISYVHAEGCAAGELKHGPIALIDHRTLLVALVPDGPTLDGMLNTIQEVKARDGAVLAFATEGNRSVEALAGEIITIPSAPEAVVPLVLSIPLQLFAYHLAVLRGCDVDQPRNLAKSVTVE